MSLVLGPIHYKMFNKIKFLDDFNRLLVGEFSDSLGSISIPFVEGNNLEDVIDESNIHGSLQSMIDTVESSFATVITEILKNDESSLETIINLAYDYSKNSLGESEDNLIEVIDSRILNGMPCSRGVSYNETTDNVIEMRCQDIHSLYWQQAGGNIEVYSMVICGFINGLCSDNQWVELVEDGFYRIKKSDKMSNVAILEEEHSNITKILNLLENHLQNVLEGDSINIGFLEEAVDFIRNYGDKHHHGKEELVLFKYMVENLGDLGKKLINNGMLVEHDLGRMYVTNLSDNLEKYKNDNDTKIKLHIVGNAFGYLELLRRHIDKENNVIYPFGINHLDAETLEKVEKESKVFEIIHWKRRNYYLNWVSNLN